MNKYFVIYRVPVETAQEWKKNTSPEEMKAQGEKIGKDMMAWTQAHKDSIVENGWPLGKNKRLTAQSATDTPNDLNYACIVQADSHEAAAKLFADNPHLQIPTSFLDIMEIPHMGM